MNKRIISGLLLLAASLIFIAQFIFALTGGWGIKDVSQFVSIILSLIGILFIGIIGFVWVKKK